MCKLPLGCRARSTWGNILSGGQVRGANEIQAGPRKLKSAFSLVIKIQISEPFIFF